MADMDQVWEGGNTSCEAMEQPEGILQLIDQPRNISGEALEQSNQPTDGKALEQPDEVPQLKSEALEQPEGILQLIDKLEDLVGHMVPG